MKNARLIVFVAVLLAFTGLQAQNILLDRAFWRSQPDLATIQNTIEKEGASATEMTPFNFDATVYAILEDNSIETIEYLLSQGNTVDKITHDGRNYLMWAAYKGNLELMQYLVKAGSDIDLVDQHGYSLFMFPASTGQSNTKIYEYMIDELGVDLLKEKDRLGRNALIASASKIKDFTLVDYFISKGLDIHSVDKDGNGIFHYAAQTGNREVLEKLVLDYKVNPVKNEKTNENAILFAARRFSRSGHENDLAFYQYLETAFDLDPAIVSNDGSNALHHLATRAKNIEVYKYFVEKGADPNQIDDKGNNALIYASGGSTKEVIELLISNTDDINASNKNGESALTNAIRSNSIEVVELLLEHGADSKVIDNRGNSLPVHAVDAYRGDITQFQKKMEILERQGVDMTSKQEDGSTLLHTAAKKNDIDLLKSLAPYNIDVNHVNNNGETALHQAALQCQNVEILKYLVQTGAKTGIKTEFEETVYDLASNNEMLEGENIDFLKSEIR